jgi:aryl-alcohol dehydrogenase-like predicted oxidoreductase
MQSTRLGSSGLAISRICLGMMSYGDTSRRAWHLEADGAEPIVRAAAEAGVTFFDTADMYDTGASEVLTGQLLRKVFARREDYVLATKVYYPMGPDPNDRGLSRQHLLSSIDASLRRLGTDYVDLYQIHRWDDTTPVEETMRPYSPLARGVLAGTRRGASDPPTTRSANDPLADSHYDHSDSTVVDEVVSIAEQRGLPPAQIALAWLLRQSGVSAPVVGATKTAHAADAIAAVDIELTAEETIRLEAPYRPHAVLGHS